MSSLIWTVKTSEWLCSLYVSKRLQTRFQCYIGNLTLVWLARWLCAAACTTPASGNGCLALARPISMTTSLVSSSMMVDQLHRVEGVQHKCLRSGAQAHIWLCRLQTRPWSTPVNLQTCWVVTLLTAVSLICLPKYMYAALPASTLLLAGCSAVSPPHNPGINTDVIKNIHPCDWTFLFNKI